MLMESILVFVKTISIHFGIISMHFIKSCRNMLEINPSPLLKNILEYKFMLFIKQMVCAFVVIKSNYANVPVFYFIGQLISVI